MSKKHLLNDPHCNGEMWWYEEAGGISIYRNTEVVHKPNEAFVGCITWRSLRAALARKDKPND